MTEPRDDGKGFNLWGKFFNEKRPVSHRRSYTLRPLVVFFRFFSGPHNFEQVLLFGDYLSISKKSSFGLLLLYVSVQSICVVFRELSTRKAFTTRAALVVHNVTFSRQV